ncbi:hypothetical protein IEO21_10639 [Rhodonia placenta]|uniref:Uncharacterized protein n=1 Tax=Rhodonia placenta TaxID=104341 RepID=A0A8H7TX89_9APHY|nr:hypothetical protein IEO21_10639 [Postia placenta]
MSSRSATPASTPSLVNRRLASLLVVLEAPPTADAALDVVEEWAQDLSPLVLAYRKALGAIRDEETELRVAAAVKQLAERASESWVELSQCALPQSPGRPRMIPRWREPQHHVTTWLYQLRSNRTRAELRPHFFCSIVPVAKWPFVLLLD